MNPADAFITTDSYCSAQHSNNSSAWGRICKWFILKERREPHQDEKN